MCKPDSGHFRGANGKGGGSAPTLFDNNGHVTYESIAAHREEFMGKTVEQIAELKQVQVSPDGSSRHGNIPYVKISTSNEGKIKVINGTSEDYKAGDNEKARMIFRREKDD